MKMNKMIVVLVIVMSMAGVGVIAQQQQKPVSPMTPQERLAQAKKKHAQAVAKHEQAVAKHEQAKKNLAEKQKAFVDAAAKANVAINESIQAAKKGTCSGGTMTLCATTLTESLAALAKVLSAPVVGGSITKTSNVPVGVAQKSAGK